MARTLASVARETHGRLIGADGGFGSVTTDSRALTAGSLFVAIPGDKFDGNDFVRDALEKGAAGALVSRAADLPLPQVEVRDTRRAFGTLARAWRASFAIPVVAVTGSSGKTTVKELVASILGVSRSVCVTQGNLNNDIGVPLTLMRLGEEHDALVAELGANHAGEIDYLARLVQPTVGIITNAGAAHLEGFGSLEGVAAAKGELLDHLPKAGTAVLNADDRFRAEWVARSPCELTVTFGFSERADCTVIGEPEFDTSGADFRMRLPDGQELDMRLPLLGRQNVANALAAAAAAEAVGVSTDDIVTGLGRASAVRGRLKSLAGAAARRSSTTATTRTRAPCARRSTISPCSAARGFSCSATWPSSDPRRALCIGRLANTRAVAAMRCSPSAPSRAKRRLLTVQARRRFPIASPRASRSSLCLRRTPRCS